MLWSISATEILPKIYEQEKRSEQLTPSKINIEPLKHVAHLYDF